MGMNAEVCSVVRSKLSEHCDVLSETDLLKTFIDADCIDKIFNVSLYIIHSADYIFLSVL